MSKKINVILTLEGGLIQNIMTDSHDVEVHIANYDTEDSMRTPNAELTRIWGDMAFYSFGVDQVDPEEVENFLEQVKGVT